MTGKNHNKRRNCGLLYEFLIRKIATSLIDGDTRGREVAISLIKRHFRRGTELNKELSIVKSLARTTVESREVAASMIAEARSASRAVDLEKLREEKDALLRSIKTTLRDESIFEAHIDAYRAYATAQTLVNEWRSTQRVNIGFVAKYEDELMRSLTTPTQALDDRFVCSESLGTNRLIEQSMVRRLNERYASVLTPSQKEIIRLHAFAAESDVTRLRMRLTVARDAIVRSIDRFITENGRELAEKTAPVRASLVAETFAEISDESIARFLSYVRLGDEIDGVAERLVEGVGDSRLIESTAPRLLVSSPEYVDRPSEMVRESITSNGGRIILAGILQKADTLNQNGRVYPRAILEREIRNYQKFINERRSTGELDHPDTSVISLKNVSHKVIEATMEGNVVRGRVEVLGTPSGKILRDLLEGDVKLGISSRGVGSTKKQGDYVVVQEDFQLICWDFVSEPSTPGAFMLPEGLRIAEGRVLTRVERIDRILCELTSH